jgi:hypothetical protein
MVPRRLRVAAARSCRRGAGQGGNSEPDGGAEPVSGGRTGGCHGDLDAANAEMHDRTDLEQLETNGAASRGGEVGVMQADTTLCTEQHVGHGGKPQAQLIGPHGGCRGAVGIEIELAFLDPVLHVAACAVELLIQVLGGLPAKAWHGGPKVYSLHAPEVGPTSSASR